MSKQTVLTCDRCSAPATDGNEVERRPLLSADHKADVCDNCAVKFEVWWEAEHAKPVSEFKVTPRPRKTAAVPPEAPGEALPTAPPVAAAPAAPPKKSEPKPGK